jgi:hypothetical protein
MLAVSEAMNNALTALAAAGLAKRSSTAAVAAATKAGSDSVFVSNLASAPWETMGAIPQKAATDRVRAGAHAAASSAAKATKAACLAYAAATDAMHWAKFMVAQSAHVGPLATVVLPSGPAVMVPVECVQTMHTVSVLTQAAKAHATAADAFAQAAQAHAAAVAWAYDWLL